MAHKLERIRESGQTVLGLVPYDIFMLFVPIKIILMLSMMDENSNNDYTFSSYKVKYIHKCSI